MARLNVEVIPPDSETMNGIFAEIERKYAHQPMTPKVIDEIATRSGAPCTASDKHEGYVRSGLTLQKLL